MFKNWCMSEECWIDLKCLSVCCGWDLNYANCLRTCHVELFMFYEESMSWMISKCYDKMLDCLVLREHCLAKHDLTAWYSSETYTDQTQSIEHIL